MDRAALARIWEKQYPEPGAADPFGSSRETEVLADMMAARKPGEEQKRPSVEALLHDILPFTFVVHLHPALVNGLTCSRLGEETMPEIFGEKAIWIAPANPGYVLAKTVKTAMDAYSSKHGKPPAIILLQNHGVFVGSNSTDGIKEIYGEIMHKIGAWIKRKPDFSGEERITSAQCVELSQEFLSQRRGDTEDAKKINNIPSAPLRLCEMNFKIIQTLADLAGFSAFMQAGEIMAMVKDRESFAPVSSAFTPDHIVYAGSNPLFVEANADIRDAWKNHVEKTGRAPKIVAVQDLGVFSAAAKEKAAGLALDLFKNAVEVAVYAESFGGPRFMEQDKINFILNWEAESYRTNISTK
jgi:rhamnose utilization protein RhaD (predicted bifunctional aldolase and dehydrogenase)